MHSNECFTLFTEDDKYLPNDCGFREHTELQSFVDAAVARYGSGYVAWAPCHPGWTGWRAIREESIAAGRVFKKVGGRCIAVTPDSDGLSDALSEQAKHLKGDLTFFDGKRAYVITQTGGAPVVWSTTADPFDTSGYEVHYDSADEVVVTIRDADPNAAMIARDGPAPDYEALEREHFGDPDKQTGIYAPKSTAHPPIAGLMQENGFSHKLGSANLGKCA